MITQPAAPHAGNQTIADRLDEAAALLEQQGSDRFRIGAFRRAARVARGWPEDLRALFERDGVDGLEALPGIGPAIARAIRELLVRGRLPMLDRLRGDADAESLLRTVPGIGRRFAAQLHLDFGISTLEALEQAAHDGTLDRLFGAKRLAGIRDSLAQRLARVRPAPSPGPPRLDEILDVDREYRERAAAGTLPTIAPRRFNRERQPWLPILHTTRHGRRYTALFSNTAHAHRLGMTRDWVVVYRDAPDGDHQYTVITAARGPRRGERIVMGHPDRRAAMPLSA
jgi:hypothetical protein